MYPTALCAYAMGQQTTSPSETTEMSAKQATEFMKAIRSEIADDKIDALHVADTEPWGSPRYVVRLDIRKAEVGARLDELGDEYGMKLIDTRSVSICNKPEWFRATFA
jgi:hypothetical protein